ncbi:YfbU family protein [Achromobacter kerstersii]
MESFDKKERLVLVNQYKILAALDKDNARHYLELVDILENGYSIFYSVIADSVYDGMSEEDGKFVLNILDIYRAIEDLKRSGKADLISSHAFGVFPGFDGNNEAEYMNFCRFLVYKQGKYEEQKSYIKKNDNFNSHAPMVEKYRRMLEISASVGDIWNLSTQDALQILNA